MKKIFIVVCIIASIFSGFSIMLGLWVAIKAQALLGYFFGVIGALVILALGLVTHDIWREKDMFHKSMRPFWIVGISAMFLTILLACCNHIILEKPIWDSVHTEWDKVFASDLLQRATVLTIATFLTAAPVAVSYLWSSFFDEEEDGEPSNVPPMIPKR